MGGYFGVCRQGLHPASSSQGFFIAGVPWLLLSCQCFEKQVVEYDSYYVYVTSLNDHNIVKCFVRFLGGILSILHKYYKLQVFLKNSCTSLFLVLGFTTTSCNFFISLLVLNVTILAQHAFHLPMVCCRNIKHDMPCQWRPLLRFSLCYNVVVIILYYSTVDL